MRALSNTLAMRQKRLNLYIKIKILFGEERQNGKIGAIDLKERERA